MWLKKFGGKTTRQEAKPKQTKLKNSSVSPRRSKRAGPKNLRQAESEQKLFERDIEQDNKKHRRQQKSRRYNKNQNGREKEKERTQQKPSQETTKKQQTMQKKQQKITQENKKRDAEIIGLCFCLFKIKFKNILS